VIGPGAPAAALWSTPERSDPSTSTEPIDSSLVIGRSAYADLLFDGRDAKPRYPGLRGPLSPRAAELFQQHDDEWVLGWLLWELRAGRLDGSEEAAQLVPRLWLRSAPKPLALAGQGIWRRLFAASGYTDDGFSRPRLTRPIHLFRGGSPSGMSWTESRRWAKTFATDFGMRPAEGHVWSTWAPPEAILCWVPLVVDSRGRTSEDEAVVDLDLLDEITPWTPTEIARTSLVRTRNSSFGLEVLQ
jgi:hypothetical protein